MRIKISERLFLPGVVLLLIGVLFLVNTTLIGSPVRISERGMMFDVAALVSLFVAVKLIRNSIHKQ